MPNANTVAQEPKVAIIGDRQKGMDLDAHIALLCLASLLLAALVLTFASGRWRALVLVAGGLLVLSFSGLVAYMNASGFQQLFDESSGQLARLRPLIVNFLGVVGFAGGILLVYSGILESRLGLPAVGSRNTLDSYGKISRSLHWLIACTVLCMIPLGIIASGVDEESVLYHRLMVVHKSLGITVFALSLVRMAWFLVSPKPGLSRQLAPWESRLAKLGHLSLYGLLLLFPLTGFLLSAFAGRDSHFFYWDIAPFVSAPDRDKLVPLGTTHKFILPMLSYLLIGIHLLGIGKHLVLDKRLSAIRRMLG